MCVCLVVHQQSRWPTGKEEHRDVSSREQEEGEESRDVSSREQEEGEESREDRGARGDMLVFPVVSWS